MSSVNLQARVFELVYTLPDSGLISPGSPYSMGFSVITPTTGGLGESRRVKLYGANTKHSLTIADSVHSSFIPSTISAFITTEPGHLGIGFDAFFSQVGTIRLFIDGKEAPHPIAMEIVPSTGGVPNSLAIGLTFD